MNKYAYYCAVAFFMWSIQAQDSDKRELTLGESMAIGSMAGATEVISTGQPLFYATNMKVAKKPISPNPFNWYRGVGTNMGFMIPITAIQKTVTDQGKQWFKQHQSQPINESQKMIAAFCGGVASGLASTPGEAIPTYMQQPSNRGISTAQAVKALGPNMYRGVTHTMLRDGFFTVGYSALTPIFAAHIKSMTDNNAGSEMAGGIGAGVVTAVGTQPSTVIKTALQTDPKKELYQNSWQAIKAIYRTDGVRGFFMGLSARGGRVICAIPILNKATEFYEDNCIS